MWKILFPQWHVLHRIMSLQVASRTHRWASTVTRGQSTGLMKIKLKYLRLWTLLGWKHSLPWHVMRVLHVSKLLSVSSKTKQICTGHFSGWMGGVCCLRTTKKIPHRQFKTLPDSLYSMVAIQPFYISHKEQLWINQVYSTHHPALLWSSYL